jgi:hypothetical protein
MSSRVDKGKRWFKWVMIGMLAIHGFKILFAFVDKNPVRIVDAIAELVVGIVIGGGLAFALGYATGGNKESTPSEGNGYSPASVPQPQHSPAVALGATEQKMPMQNAEQNPPAVVSTQPQMDQSNSTPQNCTVDEDAIYASIANELKTGAANEGLWTRLFAQCDGDENRTKVAYIKQRAERLIADEQARLELVERERELVAKAGSIEKLRLEALLHSEKLKMAICPGVR